VQDRTDQVRKRFTAKHAPRHLGLLCEATDLEGHKVFMPDMYIV
jgi:hypothetical protein